MSTTTRPELSPKSKYWVERHRYYELKHFCRQYPIWKEARTALSGLSTNLIDAVIVSKIGNVGDPTAKCVEAREFYSQRINLVESVARETDPIIGGYILEAIVDGLSYEKLKAKKNIPCGKEMYYELYRKFFWLLDKRRD